MSLEKTLLEYKEKKIYPFHMPGHKRKLTDVSDSYGIDMTEVEGVDDLHDPEGPILEDELTLAKMYGANKSFILVGGSTSGNLAAVYAALNEGDKILIQRNSHKSIYNAVALRHCQVSYLTPSLTSEGIFEAVTADEVKNAIEREPDIKAVMLTSPTYEGLLCNIKEISKICHEKNVILIVDQAHGAHLGVHDKLSGAATKYADITIMSLHKTLPAMTQTALLNLSGERVSAERIQSALDIFESSSPSYVLMNSVSHMINVIESNPQAFDVYVDNLNFFYESCANLRNLHLINDSVEKKDLGKIVISTFGTDITGVDLARILREDYLLETEMASFSYVIAMTSICDERCDFVRLSDALHEIDKKISPSNVMANGESKKTVVEENEPDKFKKSEEKETATSDISLPIKKMVEPWEAKAAAEEQILLNEAVGKISANLICIYPPGTPVVAYGEQITKEAIALIKKAQDTGLHITGLTEGSVSVVKL